MGFIDTLQEIFYSLRNNKLRTFLTGFGVFWGIFILILLLGAGKGMQNGVEQEFSSNAQDSVWIYARRTSIPYMGLPTGRSIRFVQADLDAIEREIPEVLYISAENPLRWSSGGDIIVKSPTRSESYGVYGVAESYFKISTGQDLTNGRTLNDLDQGEVRKVAAIGSTVAGNLFPGQDPVWQSIEINRIPFTVVGVFHDSGDNGRKSERIYIPMSLYQQTYGRGEERLSILTYRQKPEADPYAVEEKVVALLKKRHRVSPDDRSAIRVNNIFRHVERFNSLFAAIKSFLWFVGIGTLTAGIVGISNIMLITVQERTTEIGIRKALGATPFKIVSALLFESVLVTATAGYLGLVIGVGLLEAINKLLASSGAQMAFFKQPEVDFQIALISIVILVSVGMLAGLAPAWRASRISPVEAMRDA
jgi:putative ABC transport system permease protein